MGTRLLVIRMFTYSSRMWLQNNRKQHFDFVFPVWKVSKYGVFPVRIFLYSNWKRRFTEKNLRIQSKFRKIRTSKNSVFGHFSRSVYFWSTKWPFWSKQLSSSRVGSTVLKIILYIIFRKKQQKLRRHNR